MILTGIAAHKPGAQRPSDKRERKRVRRAVVKCPEITVGLYASREWVCMMQSRRELPGAGGIPAVPIIHLETLNRLAVADLTTLVRNDTPLFSTRAPRAAAKVGWAWELEQRRCLFQMNSGSLGGILTEGLPSSTVDACKFSL